MNLLRFQYGTLEKGQGAGAPAFALETAEGEAWTPLQVLKVIRATATGPVKIVRISGSAPEDELKTLAQTLAESGYLVQGLAPGDSFPNYLHHVHHRIVQITDPLWLGFEAAELWMQAQGGTAIADPALPGGKIPGTSFFLEANLADPGEVYRYLLHSKIPWAIIPRTSTSIQRDLLSE